MIISVNGFNSNPISILSSRPFKYRNSMKNSVRMSFDHVVTNIRKISISLCLTTALLSPISLANSNNVFSSVVRADSIDDNEKQGAGNEKLKGGGASTLQRGISKTITRGVNLDKSDFSNGDFHGVSFQQSIVRDTNFMNTNLRNAGFFE